MILKLIITLTVFLFMVNSALCQDITDYTLSDTVIANEWMNKAKQFSDKS